MARELPIQNGRLTTDLDADGHRINNLAGGLSIVAWSDVTEKPTFATVATSGSYSDLSGKPTLATVATSGSYSDLSNKPTIPTVDPVLSLTSENPVQNKAVAAALYTGFTEWEFSDGGSHTLSTLSLGLNRWIYSLDTSVSSEETFSAKADALSALSLTFYGSTTITATRHLITPTKTSQLINDGADGTGRNNYVGEGQFEALGGMLQTQKRDKTDLATYSIAPWTLTFDGGSTAVLGWNATNGRWEAADGRSYLYAYQDGDRYYIGYYKHLVDLGYYSSDDMIAPDVDPMVEIAEGYFDFRDVRLTLNYLDGWGEGPCATASRDGVYVPDGGSLARLSQVPTNAVTSAELASATNLTPVYGGNGQEFTGEWTFSGDTVQGETYELDVLDYSDGLWDVRLFINDTKVASPEEPSAAPLSLTFEDALTGTERTIIATPVRNPIVGYTLGGQSTKPLQPMGDYLTQHQSLAGLMPLYTFATATPTSGALTVSPYTVATFAADSTAATFTVAVGTGTAGTARECILVIDCTATGAVAPTVTWPSNFHPRTDTATDLAIVEAGKRAVFYISEYASGEFAVGGWQETEGGSGT